MAFDREKRSDSPMKRRGGRRRKKVCVYCADKNAVIDYKDVNKLKDISLKEVRFFLEESQETVQNIRELLQLLSKRARHIALMPYIVD